MTSRTPSKPSSEQLQTLSPLLLHRGKPRYTVEDLLQGAHSLRLLCSRLQSSHPSESSKPILTSLEECLELNLQLLEDLQTSSSEEDSPDRPT